jgi:hypothetical protein
MYFARIREPERSGGDAQGMEGVRSSREAAGANAEPRTARWGPAPCAHKQNYFKLIDLPFR